MQKRILFPGALDISNDEYHGDTSRISKSGIKLIAQSPAHYYAKYLDPNKEPEKRSDALILGSATHAAVFEPHLFERTYTIVPQSAPKRPTTVQLNAKKVSDDTKRAIAFWQKFDNDNIGVEVLSVDDFMSCIRMRDAVQRHPAASQIISSGIAEQTFYFTEPETGAPCKVRPDWIRNDGLSLIADLKTDLDASPRAFGYSARKYGYDIQAPLYLDGVKYATGIEIDTFVFIVVEKKPPFAVAVYAIDADDIRIGREIYLQHLSTYMQCRSHNVWNSYSDAVMKLQLPKLNQL